MKSLLAIVILALLIPIAGSGNTCLLVDSLTGEEWVPPNSVFPNYLCIFPDGRTGMSDAKYTFDLVFGALYQPVGDPVGCDFQYLGKSIDFAFSGPGVVLCEGGSVYSPCTFLPCAFSMYSISGGGHSPIDGAGNPMGVVAIAWAPDDCPSGCQKRYVEFYVNSPDISGDLSVDLSDQAIFANDLYGAYNFRSDFNLDGYIALSDLSIFSSAYGIGCGN